MLDTMQIDQMHPLADSPLVGTTTKKPVTPNPSSRSKNFRPTQSPDPPAQSLSAPPAFRPMPLAALLISMKNLI